MKFIVNPKMYAHPDPEINRLVETKDIVEYPIAEAQKDSSGQPVWDKAAGTYRTTGKTLEVSILRGTGAWLDPYVADIILDRYEFLQDATDSQKEKSTTTEKTQDLPRTSVEEPPKPPVAEVKVAGEHSCSQCGQRFKTAVNLGTHLGAKHPEFLMGK